MSESSQEDIVIHQNDCNIANQQNENTTPNNWRDDFNKKRNNPNDVEMEITFNQGFENLGNRILDKQKTRNETPHQTYLRHKNERK